MVEPPPTSAVAEHDRDRVDSALRQVLTEGPACGLYAGPWWRMEPDRASSGSGTGWKCAVLRRRPEGGADHLGHLYLLGIGTAESVSMVGGSGHDGLPVQVRQWSLPSDHGPLVLVARAREGTGGDLPLVRLAASVVERLRPDA